MSKHNIKSIERRFVLIVILGVCLTLFSGCDFLRNLFGSSGQEIELPPQELAYQGMDHLRNENYQDAADTFQKLKDRYPYSRYAILAELKMADALFFQKEYKDAVDAYSEFERMHPKNEAVPYVIYQVGMCYYNLMPTPDRDQMNGVKAIQTFSRLRRLYPDSRYAGMALSRLTEAQHNLAGHEFRVGEFYYKMNAYKAALGRFISLIKTYPDTGYHARAMTYIRQCRLKLSDEEAAEAEEEATKGLEEKASGEGEPASDEEPAAAESETAEPEPVLTEGEAAADEDPASVEGETTGSEGEALEEESAEPETEPASSEGEAAESGETESQPEEGESESGEAESQ